MKAKFLRDAHVTMDEMKKIVKMSDDQALSILSLVENFYMRHIEHYNVAMGVQVGKPLLRKLLDWLKKWLFLTKT